MQSPFVVQNERLYATWRRKKLLATSTFLSLDSDQLLIEINNANSLSDTDKKHILDQCDTNSMSLYRIKQPSQNNKKSVHSLADQLGLNTLIQNICADDDLLTSITQRNQKKKFIYIPYSNKKLSWHTDGYYNTPDKQVNSMLLHCAHPAQSGGETFLMDHEIAYLLLRDENPQYIEALMQADTMTIPANIIDGKTIRAAQTGPVFSINKLGQLHMRYTARKRNIEWKQSTPILEAVEFLDKLFSSNSEYIVQLTLQAGEGLICRNVLHCRSRFVDGENPQNKRLLYRGRYSDNLSND